MKTFIYSFIISFVVLYVGVAFISFDINFLEVAGTAGRFALLFFTLIFAVLGTICIEETK